MCFVYVVKNGATIGVTGGMITIGYPDSTVERIPKGIVDGVSLFSRAVLTTSFVDYCLENDVRVGFFNSKGDYRGCLSATPNTNAERLRKQICLSTVDEFSLSIARRIIAAKINNQIVLVRRYCSGNDVALDYRSKMNYIAKRKIKNSSTINQVMGYEGIVSRYYFKSLAAVIESDFRFEKRTRRPARDPFNCMLNLGYSVLAKEIFGEIVNRNLNPYIGFIHQDRQGHPSLASDLMEEWRAVIVDATVMSLIQGHEIRVEEFSIISGKCIMSEKAKKILLTKLERKMETKTNYLSYIDKPLSFRESIWHQADRLGRAIESGDASLYSPIKVR